MYVLSGPTPSVNGWWLDIPRANIMDTPPGFAVYPNKRHLDKGIQETDIADISSREAAKAERDIPRAK